MGERDLARGVVASELSRRDFLQRASVLGAGAMVLSALPIAERLIDASPARAADVSFDNATMQAFADTIIPGRKVAKTEFGDDIHPQAIAGVDREPGAVEADVLRLFHHPLTGFDALEPALLADLSTRSLAEGGTFLSLDYDKRVAVCLSGLSFDNPTRVVWEAGAAVPFTVFCAAALHPIGTSDNSVGYSVMGHPGAAPRGYRNFSYNRKLSKERTKKGYLA